MARPEQRRHATSAAVHLMLIDGIRLLLARRCNTGYHDGEWSLPSGHVEADETITDAAVREAKEELGITLDREHTHVVHTMHRRDESGRPWINVFLTVDQWSGQPTIQEPDKCDGLRWVSYLDPLLLPQDTIPYVAYAVAVALDGQTYSEIGWE